MFSLEVRARFRAISEAVLHDPTENRERIIPPLVILIYLPNTVERELKPL